MYNFITFKCTNCESVIFNLPEKEAKKLVGLTFECECCNHLIRIEDIKSEKIYTEALLAV